MKTLCRSSLDTQRHRSYDRSTAILDVCRVVDVAPGVYAGKDLMGGVL